MSKLDLYGWCIYTYDHCPATIEEYVPHVYGYKSCPTAHGSVIMSTIEFLKALAKHESKGNHNTLNYRQHMTKMVFFSIKKNWKRIKTFVLAAASCELNRLVRRSSYTFLGGKTTVWSDLARKQRCMPIIYCGTNTLTQMCHLAYFVELISALFKLYLTHYLRE